MDLDGNLTSIPQLLEAVGRAAFFTKDTIMIYGYDIQTVNDHGLKQMGEVSLSVPSAVLRKLAAFLLQAADELEIATSPHWHKHSPSSLESELGCNVIIISHNLIGWCDTESD